jgi:hypothetical protein
LFVGNQRSHLRGGIESRSDFDFLGLVGNAGNDLIEGRLSAS